MFIATCFDSTESSSGLIGTICVHKVLAHILGSQKCLRICLRKDYLIVYNCNFAKYNWILYILTTILGFLQVIWLHVFALWCIYCAPVLAGMCPTSVRLLFSAHLGSNVRLHGSVPVLRWYTIAHSNGVTESQVLLWSCLFVCGCFLLRSF